MGTIAQFSQDPIDPAGTSGIEVGHQQLPRLTLRAHLLARQSTYQKACERLLGLLRSGLGATCTPAGKNWILFQFYHWVLEDERASFRNQLQTLRRYGDFISLDDAVSALHSRSALHGRYFCVTFDDGFRNCVTTAAPVLKDLNIPAAFFIPTKYIGLELDRDWTQIAPFYKSSYSGYGRFFEFLDWSECQQLASAGFAIGSHTHTHARLTSISAEQAEQEMTHSKQIIEKRLGISCRHFCCPWGKVKTDYAPDVHPLMARKAGYVSFLTTDHGMNRPGGSVYTIRRISSSAGASSSLMRYSLFPWWKRLTP